MNKTILVTGGAGFVGSNLLEKLNEYNYNTISIDNYSTGSVDNHNTKTKYIVDDINNPINIDTKIDVIVHCAAKARIQQSFNDDSEYFLTNIIGTYNIVKFATKNNIPLIYTGTSSHHGGRFSNPYTFTKDIAEDIIKLYQDNFNLKASIARLYNVYGPKELTNKNGTLIGKLKYNYKHNLPFIIYGDGSKRRDFTHVYDIVDGIYRIIEQEKYNYTFEFGRGKNYSIKEIIEMFKYTNISYKENLFGEMYTTLVVDDSAKKLLNWSPKYNIEDYIKSIIEDKTL